MQAAASAPVLDFFSGRRLPVLLQTEAAECGLACLAMVASYWGHQIDLPSIRRRYSVSLKGATLKSLLAMALGLELQSRPLKLDLQHLRNLKLPCVLHWDMNHFVVLKAVRADGIVIHDPAVGERRIRTDDVSKHFTGVAIEITPGASFQRVQETLRFSLLSLTGRVAGLKRSLLQLLLLAVALQVCTLLGPLYLQWIVDEALVSADRDLITVLAVGFLLMMVMQSAIGAVRSWVTTVLATSFNFQWLGNAFAHLMRLPLSFFEKRHVGDIVSRFGSIQAIQKGITTQFVEAVIDGMLVIAAVVVMLQYSVQLTAIAICNVAIYVAVRCAIYASLRAATADQIIHAALQQTHFLESVRGAQSVRLFNRGDERRVSWLDRLAEQFNAEITIARLSITQQSVQTLLFGLERIVVIWLAALAVLDARFTVGMLFAFISFKDQFTQRVASLVDKVFEFRMLRLHGERVADILLAEPERDDHAGAAIAPDVPAIEIRDLSFRYADGEPDVVHGLNLRVAPGECVAITGVSGCGKTTLVKLLLGLLEPTEGEILVGGVALKRVGLANYRSLVGTVMQDDTLFTGSIADNITFFDPEGDHQRAAACAHLAAVHQEIVAMPMGYGTLVGNAGAGLSGGQKQRILLARALYKQPKVLVLDEATSHLDLGNEQLVNAAIRQIALTRILVAHRPETIAMAQRVVVLEQGRIVRDLEQTPVTGIAGPVSVSLRA
ncbi:MAG: peptidase domain-containing ABC transporter [Ramlibacter sp.]